MAIVTKKVMYKYANGEVQIIKNLDHNFGTAEQSGNLRVAVLDVDSTILTNISNGEDLFLNYEVDDVDNPVSIGVIN